MLAQAHEVLFEEKQRFRQTWLWVLMPGILLLLVSVLVFAVFQTPARGDYVQGIVVLVLVLAVNVGLCAFLYYLTLSVRVDANGLHVRFFPLVKKDIPLGDIARWEVRTYRPILEYGGWGVRCSWKGMAYNVSGNRGVQLVFTNGKRLLIGSQRSDELAAAIGRAKHPGG